MQRKGARSARSVAITRPLGTSGPRPLIGEHGACHRPIRLSRRGAYWSPLDLSPFALYSGIEAYCRPSPYSPRSSHRAGKCARRCSQTPRAPLYVTPSANGPSRFRSYRTTTGPLNCLCFSAYQAFARLVVLRLLAPIQLFFLIAV